MQNDDVEVTALCDSYEPYILRGKSKTNPKRNAIGKVPEMGESFGKDVKRCKDFKKFLRIKM
jgi:hypothetical protein